jgi:CubicO group peptidase (beta-lactamase class C family)
MASAISGMNPQFNNFRQQPETAMTYPSMNPPSLRRSATIAFFLAISSYPAIAQVDESAGLESIRASNSLPGLSAVMVKEGIVVAQGAAGIRRMGSSTPLRASDRVNMASCTKFMTATIAARLVGKKKIAWTTRVRDVFAGSGKFHASFRDVTLDELLAHRAGVQDRATFESRHWNTLFTRSGSVMEIRRWVAETVLRDAPQVSRGTYLYSNQGYTVAAAMMEEVTGKPWESLIQSEVIKPLRLKSGKLGCCYTSTATPVAPHGHDLAAGSFTPVARTTPSATFLKYYSASNAAGGHFASSITDYAKFIHAHLTVDDSFYLTYANGMRLQTPWAGGDGYGRGVNVLTRSWAAPGQALQHSGDIFGHNTVFWASPGRDVVVVAFTNCLSADSRVSTALDNAVSLLLSKHLEAPASGAILEKPSLGAVKKKNGKYSVTGTTLPALSYSLKGKVDGQPWKTIYGPFTADGWNTTFQLPAEYATANLRLVPAR